MKAVREEAVEALREVYCHLSRRAREGDREAWELAHRLDQTAPEIVREAEVTPVTFTTFSPGRDREERS